MEFMDALVDGFVEVQNQLEPDCGYLCDIRGNPTKRHPMSYPYSYDAYVIWAKEYKENDNAVYSDRLYQWDSEKYDRCCMEVWNDRRQVFNRSSPKEIQKFLSLYFGETVKLTGIEKGCNVSTGYPYWVFYYRAE